MAYVATVQLQPGDGSWLLHNGSSQKPKKRGSRRVGKHKLETFLVRNDSGIDGDEDSMVLQDCVDGVQRADNKEINANAGSPSFANANTIANAALLSRPQSSHQDFEKKRVKSFALRTSARQPLTSFLSCLPPKQDTNDVTPHLLSNTEQCHAQSTTMVIPPHLRRKAAAQAASTTPCTTSLPVASNQDSSQLKLPPSPPISDDIRSKLSSIGVKVVGPDTIADWTAHSLVGESIDSSQPNPESAVPSEKHVFRGRGTINVRGRGGGRGGRGGGQASGSNVARDAKPHSRNVFCKSSEIPKSDPKRWETDWTGMNHGQSNEKSKSNGKHAKSHSFDTMNSVQVNAGRASGGRRKQPSHDSAGWTLQDWDGNWAPAPMDWDFRPGFRKGQHEKQIQTWLDMMEGVAMKGVNRQPNLNDLPVVDGFTYTFGSPQNPIEGTNYVTMGEIVPSYWVRPHFYGRVPLSTFFEENIKSNSPSPVDENDLAGAKPWWETVVRGGSFLKPCTNHDHNGVDPMEGLKEKMRRQCDFGSQHATDNKKRYELARRGIDEEKLQRAAEKAARKDAMKNANGGITPEHLRPIKHNSKDLFLRHACFDDMAAVRDIYNYYVDFSTSVPETKRLTVMDIREQLQNITQHSKLPYLIAYERGKLIKGRRKNGHRLEDPIQLPDEIVGFIRANEYGSGTDSYRFTATLEVFVHKDHLMKGIARCLMDKTLALLDPDHIEQGGYLVCDDDLHAAKPSRKIKHIVINYLYHSGRPERIARMSKWLVDELRFREVGNLNGIGTKLTAAINKTIFMRETGMVLDHVHPPETMMPPQTAKIY